LVSAEGTWFRPYSIWKAKLLPLFAPVLTKGTVVHADEAGSWDNLHERFEVERINQETRSLDGACPNWAKEHVSRVRRAEVGIHHQIAGADVLRPAPGSSRRKDHRGVRSPGLLPR
jgi:hypothetical protein